MRIELDFYKVLNVPIGDAAIYLLSVRRKHPTAVLRLSWDVDVVELICEIPDTTEQAKSAVMRAQIDSVPKVPERSLTPAQMAEMAADEDERKRAQIAALKKELGL